jgi:hypothetical protein
VTWLDKKEEEEKRREQKRREVRAGFSNACDVIV